MAKRIDFFDGVDTETVPVVTNSSAAFLLEYASDAAYEAVNGAGAAGSIYYNTTDDTVRYYDVGAASWVEAETTANKNVANGYAPLDGTGKVPAANLPSYVDDVLEYADLAALPVTGETGILYVTLDTNLVYRWTGSIYVEVSASSIVASDGVAGAVQFSDGAGDFSSDDTNFHWDDANNRLGIGTNAPSYALEVNPSSNGTVAKFGNGGYVSAFGGDGFFSAGATVSSGGVWTARASAAAISYFTVDGRYRVFANTGLTVSATFNPTERFSVNSSGARIHGGTLQLDGATSGNTLIQGPAVGASTTYTLPASPTNGYVLQTDGSGVTSWVPNGVTPSAVFDPTPASEWINIFSDMHWYSGFNGGPLEMTAIASGGAHTRHTGESSRPGIVRSNSGTAANQYASLFTALAGIKLGDADYSFSAGVKVEQTPTVSEDFRYQIGLSSGVNGLSSGTSISIGVDYAVSTTNIVCRTGASGVSTTTDSGVAIDTANFQNWRIVINTDASEVTFYINGTLVATHTTNIPSATAMGFQISLFKVAGSSNQYAQIDWAQMSYKLNTARGTF